MVSIDDVFNRSYDADFDHNVPYLDIDSYNELTRLVSEALKLLLNKFHFF